MMKDAQISNGLKRLAIALRRQDPIYELTRCCGSFYAYDSTGAIIGACALGKIGLEFFGAEEVWKRTHERIEPKSFMRDILKECGLPKIQRLHPLSQKPEDLLEIIACLNDLERWSFMAIALWLEREAESIELAQHSLSQGMLWS